MIKGITHAHLGPIWYHSEPSDFPYFPNRFLGLDFFAVSYRKPALVLVFSNLLTYYEKGNTTIFSNGLYSYNICSVRNVECQKLEI
jgi:hypothetical protein